ncbi:MAG TPA: metallophosphoesterase, partial [Archangium sp.]|nr:metallophosphoesterase [Archangium sp.]
EKTSRKLAWQNLLLIRHSPLFGLMTGALYLLLALVTYTEIGSSGLTQLPQVLSAVASSVVTRPWSRVLGLSTIGGLMGFADKDFGRWRWLAGGLHSLAHITAAFLVAWGGMYFTASVLGICQEILPGNTLLVPGATLCAAGWKHVWAKFFLGAFFTFLGGFLVGPFIMGLYLMVSVNGFKAHSNEAFISLAIADFKNFLRLRIDKEGQLTVFPVGLERVPRQWKATHAGPYAPAYEPDDPRATPPELIEPPIRVMPRGR